MDGGNMISPIAMLPRNVRDLSTPGMVKSAVGSSRIKKKIQSLKNEGKPVDSSKK